MLYLTKRQLKASKFLSQNLRKGTNGLVIIDPSFPLRRVISLLSITLRPLIMSIKVVKEKPLFLMHQTRNGFSLPIKMCNMGRTMWWNEAPIMLITTRMVLLLSRRSMLTATTTRERIPWQGLNGKQLLQGKESHDKDSMEKVPEI